MSNITSIFRQGVQKFCIFLNFKMIVSHFKHIWHKGCGDVIVSIDTRNQWNKFNNDYQIDDLSRMHARRTSAINRRHRWTPYRTLMHSVISRRFMILPHTSMFGCPAFLSRISPPDHNSSRASNTQFKKKKNTRLLIAQYSTLSLRFMKLSRKSLWTNNFDEIIPNKNGALRKIGRNSR